MPCRPAALGQEGHITQPHDFHKGWQAVVLNAGELRTALRHFVPTQSYMCIYAS